MLPDDAHVHDVAERFFELSIDLLCSIDAPSGRFTAANRAWEETLGWPPHRLIGRPFMELVHPEDTSVTLDAAAALRAADHRLTQFQNRWRAADGSYRRLLWSVRERAGVWYCIGKDVTEAHEAQVQLRRSEELHRTLTSHLPDTTVLLLDQELRILLIDGEAARRFPWFDAESFRGRKVTDLYSEVPADVMETVLDHYRAALRGERRTFDVDSEGLTFAAQAVPVAAEDGGVEAALVLATDVTERRRAQHTLDRRARQQDAVAEFGQFAMQTRDMTAVMDRALRSASDALDADAGAIVKFDALTGVPSVAGIVGLPDDLTASQVMVSAHAEALLKAAIGGTLIVDDLRSETRFKPSPALLENRIASTLSVAIEVHDRPYGRLIIHARRPQAFTSDDASFLKSVSTLIAVAIERHLEEQTTRHAALHDSLTGIPNRALALDRLAHALARRRRDGAEVALLLLDLDRFKNINDSAGHAAGDEVLMAMAPRLTASVRPTDTVARLGGDEFVVICVDIDTPRGAMEVAQRLDAAISRPLMLGSGEHQFTASIGIAVATSANDTAESLLRDADAALYRAKDRGRARYELFDEAMRAAVMKRVRTEADLRVALQQRDEQLQVWYQPVVDLHTGRALGTEALVRWQHPDHGLVLPGDFIAVAEESGLITDLGMHVLEVACRQTAAWQERFGRDFFVSVNTSGRQTVNSSFPADVARVARDSGLAPNTLGLEITETMLIEDRAGPLRILHDLRHHGLTLVLDDFGTGYSSLSRLKRLPLSVLKIDRSFVAGVATNGDDMAIVKATIDMAHAVGLTVVAEGVETVEQQSRLQELGCDQAQGYLYARPQPASAITDMLTRT